MAITRHIAELILGEHRFRPIQGQVLLLGRQTVFMTPEQAQRLVERSGVTLRANARIDYCKNADAPPKQWISDSSFFSLFTDAHVLACDISSYEQADLIFDLTGNLPPSTLSAYDFIYNGSVLDNVFDPATGIRNISRMLKPDGVVFHEEGMEHNSEAYLKFTPDWFFDYYAANGFADFQSYVCTHDNIHNSPWSVFEWNAYNKQETSWHMTMPMLIKNCAVVVAIAQKSATATTDANPVQSAYRSDHSTYLEACARFSQSRRRSVMHAGISKPTFPGYLLLGTIG